MPYRLITTLLCAGALAGCDPEPSYQNQRWWAMATWVDLEIATDSSPRAEVALPALATWLKRFERDYYAWAEDGELARLNAALALGQTLRVSPEMAGLLQRAVQLSVLSEGWFDPGIGALVALWGFHAAPSSTWRAPAAHSIRAALEAGGIRRLQMTGDRISSDSTGLVIDLGAIAKGYAVDHLVAVLRAHGVGSALVNAGGDLRVLGSRQGRPWRIGIRDPSTSRALAVLRLADGEAAFTSGDYERTAEGESGRAHHLLDPRTGWPATHTRSVTVIAADGVTADAAATAIFVAGPAHWRRIAAALGIDAVLRVGAHGEVEMTPAMRDRIEAEPPDSSDILSSAQAEVSP